MDTNPNQLIEQYMTKYPWILSFAVTKCKPSMKSLRYAGVDDDDIASECYIAIVRAAQKWKPGHGAEFTTYANQSIFMHLQSLERRTREHRQRYALLKDSHGGKGYRHKGFRSVDAMDEMESRLKDLPEPVRHAVEHTYGLNGCQRLTVKQYCQKFKVNRSVAYYRLKKVETA